MRQRVTKKECVVGHEIKSTHISAVQIVKMLIRVSFDYSQHTKQEMGKLC